MTREEAIQVLTDIKRIRSDEIAKAIDMAIEALSADTVSREEYEETDGVVKIEKQNANEVGEIKHIVIHSPNYTRYFYNESMPTSADAVQGELVRCKDCKYKRLYDERLYDEGETKYYYCALEDRPNRNWSVDDTDYCSWGERREK